MSDPRLYPWMALRRVDDGGMAKSAGAYFDRGRPTPGHLTESFDQLLRAGTSRHLRPEPVQTIDAKGSVGAG